MSVQALLSTLPWSVRIEEDREGPCPYTCHDGTVMEDLPPFREVQATVSAGEGSSVRVYTWLPKEWNGRFLGTGSGGAAGYIAFWSLADGIRRGYAVAYSDLGTFPDLMAGHGNPEMWADFGHRANHMMATVGKALCLAHYGKSPDYSYYVGASTGGQQGLSLAQRYPEDFDGIVSGVPANNRTCLHAYFVWNYQALHTEDGTPMFTDDQIRRLQDRVTALFVEEGLCGEDTAFIPDPGKRGTEWIDTLLEKLGEEFSPAQKEALRKIYEGPVNPRTGERIYTPYPYGAEASPVGLDAACSLAAHRGLFYPFYWVFGPDYDLLRFDFDGDMDTYQNALAPYVNANSPDLSAFRGRGGKLLIYSGTADPLVPYQDAVSYYERVVEAMGGLEQTQDFCRFFVIPGMAHSTGGPGADRHPKVWLDGALKEPLDGVRAWREEGRPPDELRALREEDGKLVMNRPVPPYPERFTRDGMPKLAERFAQ